MFSWESAVLDNGRARWFWSGLLVMSVLAIRGIVSERFEHMTAMLSFGFSGATLIAICSGSTLWATVILVYGCLLLSGEGGFWCRWVGTFWITVRSAVLGVSSGT